MALSLGVYCTNIHLGGMLILSVVLQQARFSLCAFFAQSAARKAVSKNRIVFLLNTPIYIALAAILNVVTHLL